MIATEHHITFGPVPSRRLGRSLGINNVTAKTCSYACIYCQVGPTTEYCIEPREFFTPREIRDAVSVHLERLRAGGQRVDYLTFVPDGEPTLDSRLGESIAVLREFGIPVAVLTNASLLSRPGVRARLATGRGPADRGCTPERGLRGPAFLPAHRRLRPPYPGPAVSPRYRPTRPTHRSAGKGRPIARKPMRRSAVTSSGARMR